MVPTVRSNGGAAPELTPNTTASVSNESLPEVWRGRAQAAKLTDREVAEFCHATGQTVDQFFKGLESGKFMTAAVVESNFRPR
jgi:hypothetical protein